MPQINQLSATNALKLGDLFVIFSNDNGDSRKIPASLLLEFMQSNLEFGGDGEEVAGQQAYATQYASPSSGEFDVAITDGTDNNTNVHLILTPTAGYEIGAITLPPVASCVDKQEVLVNCTQQIFVFTVNGNGATVTGEPTALAADDFFRLKYDAPSQVWYRVG